MIPLEQVRFNKVAGVFNYSNNVFTATDMARWGVKAYAAPSVQLVLFERDSQWQAVPFAAVLGMDPVKGTTASMWLGELEEKKPTAPVNAAAEAQAVKEAIETPPPAPKPAKKKTKKKASKKTSRVK